MPPPKLSPEGVNWGSSVYVYATFSRKREMHTQTHLHACFIGLLGWEMVGRQREGDKMKRKMKPEIDKEGNY